MHKYEPRLKYAMHGVQVQYDAWNRSNQNKLTHKGDLTILPLVFLFIYKLTMH
jgi:hypothetical protein